MFVSGIEAAYDSRVRANVVKCSLIQGTIGRPFFDSCKFHKFHGFLEIP